MAATTNKQTFSMKELKCEKVVVFTDRAEVRRLVRTKLNKGENELLLSGVSSQIDRDSVRVEGHGQATVVDVVCQSRHVVESNKIDNSDSKVKELKNEIKELEAQIEKNTHKLSRNGRQSGILNDFANTLARPTNPGGVVGGGGAPINLATLNSSENVNNFMSFISTFAAKSESLDNEKTELTKEAKELNDKLNVARENLNKLIGYETYNEIM
jgi:hypothetical protein